MTSNFSVSVLKLRSLAFLLLTVASRAVAETKQFTTSDDTLYTYDFVPAEDSQPTIFFVHGFPSGRQDWHRQIENLTAAGFGIVAPDCLGYGDTDAPLEVGAYNLKRLAGHLDALLKSENLETVVGVGHDWGVTVLSNTAVYHPDRFEKLVFMNVPYNPPGPFDIDAINAETLRTTGYTRFGYWYFFNAFDAVDVLSEHLASVFSLCFPVVPSIWRDNLAALGGMRAWLNANTTTASPSYLTREEKDDWLRRFGTRDAFAASLNYYRSNFAGTQVADAAQVTEEDKVLRVPVMSIAGALEVISAPDELQAAAQAYATQEVRAEVLQGGHWLMFEKTEEVNALLSDFAARR